MENSVDRISKLPEAIMLQILFLLPKNEDVIRMTLVSKSWQNLWKSQPAQHLDFDSDTGHPISYYRPHPRRKTSSASNKHVASPIDRSLQMLDEDGGRGRKVINYFRLRGRVPSQNQSWHVDRWIKSVTKHYVKEMHLQFIDVPGVPKYRFPRFDVGSLVVLTLRNCVLEEDLVEEGGSTRFCCLRELRLSYVDVNGSVLEKLPFLCPSLQKLEFFKCLSDDGLELGHLRKRIKTVQCDLDLPI